MDLIGTVLQLKGKLGIRLLCCVIGLKIIGVIFNDVLPFGSWQSFIYKKHLKNVTIKLSVLVYAHSCWSTVNCVVFTLLILRVKLYI